MGGAAGPELAAAVSNAGGLGVLGAAACTPTQLDEWIVRTRALTDRPFGVDTLLPASVPKNVGQINQDQGRDGASKAAKPEGGSGLRGLVSAELLEAHGAVSEPVCKAMARGAKELFGADYALATTGIAGPSGGTSEKPVGLVYVGLAGKDTAPDEGVTVQQAKLWGDRENVRTLAAARALDLLRRAIS